MFIALDESHIPGSAYSTVGCVVFPLESLPELEKSSVELRIDKKLWGEIGWKNLPSRSGKYMDAYLELANEWLSRDEVTAHTWTYKTPTRRELALHYGGDPEKPVYKHTFLLLRNIIRKCLNADHENTFYILVDRRAGTGRAEIEFTRKVLRGDFPGIAPRPNIEFCNQGSSCIVTALQVADLCTGATEYSYLRDESPGERRVCKESLHDKLVNLNAGVSLKFSPPRLPRITDYKIHHCLCDPNL